MNDLLCQSRIALQAESGDSRGRVLLQHQDGDPVDTVQEGAVGYQRRVGSIHGEIAATAAGLKVRPGGRRPRLFGNGCQKNSDEPNLHVQLAVRKVRKVLVDFGSGVVEVGHRQRVLAGRFVREDDLHYGFGVCA